MAVDDSDDCITYLRLLNDPVCDDGRETTVRFIAFVRLFPRLSPPIVRGLLRERILVRLIFVRLIFDGLKFVMIITTCCRKCFKIVSIEPQTGWNILEMCSFRSYLEIKCIALYTQGPEPSFKGVPQFACYKRLVGMRVTSGVPLTPSRCASKKI